MKKTLAIFSPNENAYSETFIQAHKNLPFKIKYYYNGSLPTKLEGAPNLFQFGIIPRIKKRITTKFTLSEHALMQSLKKEKVDCVLAEYGPTACDTLRVVEFLKIPMIVHFHGYDASSLPVLNKYARQYQLLFAYATAVIAVSKKMREDLITLGCPENKLRVTPCGPNAHFLNTNPTYTNPQFVAIGRFIEKKAPYITIAAFKKVVERFPKARLIMVGQGELLSTCKSLARALDLRDNVEFKEVLTPKEIQSLFEASLAFVQHSIVAENGDSEGTPVAILEAQAAALPVISTYHAGIPDVVIHNETGLLAKEFDIEAMVGNMLRILMEEGLAQQFGAAGRKRIIDNFSMDKHLCILTSVINDTIYKRIVNTTV